MKRSHSRSRGGKGASTAGGGAPSAPVFSTAIVSNGDTTHVILTYNVTLGTSTSTTIGDYTLTSSGKSISAVSRVGATISLTTTAWANGDTGTIAVAAGKVFEATNTTAAGALSAQSITNNVAPARITFTDPFTGADGSAPNARWTGSPAGWEINTNHLRFIGASVGTILATCTAGNNTLDVDCDFSSASASFGAFYISYTDANNNAFVQLNASETLTINSMVSGSNTVVATDTGHTTRLQAAAHIQVANVGTTVTVTVTGGLDPGTFNGTVGAGAIGGTQVGLFMNTGKTSNFFDNCVLS